MNAHAKSVSILFLPFVTFPLKPKQVLSQPAVLSDSCFCCRGICYSQGVFPAFWALVVANSQSFLGTNSKPLTLVFGWEEVGAWIGAV